MNLSEEQEHAFQTYLKGYNLFITGPGGTGKSAFIHHIYKHANINNKRLQVCAMTGCAAILLQCRAKTLHSWSGIGLGNGTVEQIIKKISKNSMSVTLWKEIEVLIVDEVSMLSLKLFDLLNAVGKTIRGNHTKPFGGIQLIFSGDFFQLPPVGDREDPDTQRFCFESGSWNEVFPNQIVFKHMFRQTDDTFATMLNEIRKGKIKRKTNDILLQCVNKPIHKTCKPTKLYPTRSKAEEYNQTMMSTLVAETRVYSLRFEENLEMTKTQQIKRLRFSEKEVQYEMEYLANNLICEKETKLKKGSQVMCIVNTCINGIRGCGGIELCNGSQGIVTGFCEISGLPIVKFDKYGDVIMKRHIWESEKIPGVGVSHVPLILSWALTIHKSQGMTLETAEIDAGSGIFECGQTYVALSRVKTLEGLFLTSFDPQKIRVHKKVQEYYEFLEQQNNQIKQNMTVSTSKPKFQEFEYIV